MKSRVEWWGLCTLWPFGCVCGHAWLHGMFVAPHVQTINNVIHMSLTVNTMTQYWNNYVKSFFQAWICSVCQVYVTYIKCTNAHQVNEHMLLVGFFSVYCLFIYQCTHFFTTCQANEYTSSKWTCVKLSCFLFWFVVHLFIIIIHSKWTHVNLTIIVVVHCLVWACIK